jgi:hypothetical protein
MEKDEESEESEPIVRGSFLFEHAVNAVVFGELQELKTAVEDLRRALGGLTERIVKSEVEIGVKRS